jgi:hypothetical protein
VENIDTKFVGAELISTLLNEEFAQLDITFEGAEMQRCEAILLCAIVTKVCEFHSSEGALTHRNNESCDAFVVMETSLM